MEKGKRLSREVVQKRLTEAWHHALKDCFGVTHPEAARLLQTIRTEIKKGKRLIRSDEQELFNSGIVVALAEIARDSIEHAQISTEEQLVAALEKIEVVRDKMPAATRKAMKTLSSILPRRGGPGRQPKLTPKEASRACDHIAMFIRQKHTVKQALQLMADSSISILGKKVGARTLQKAWDRRDQFGP